MEGIAFDGRIYQWDRQHVSKSGISFLAEGVYAVTLITSNPYGSDTLTKSNLIYATANLPVSLENTPDEMTICGYELEDYELVAGGANSYSFDVSKADHFTVSQSGNTLTLTLKDAIRKDGAFDSWIKVTGTHGNCSASDSVLVHVVMPQNDDIANAIRLEPGKNVVVSNQCGTVETYEPSPDDYGCTVANNWCPDDTGTLLNNSVWFTFRGPSSGWVTITTEGFDNQIAVYDAGSSADLLSGSSGRYTLLAANDDNSTSGAEARIENLAVEPGKIYWLQVDGNNSAYGKSTIYLLSNSLDVYPNPSDGLLMLLSRMLTNVMRFGRSIIYREAGLLPAVNQSRMNRISSKLIYRLFARAFIF
jgi:PKD repeat protein